MHSKLTGIKTEHNAIGSPMTMASDTDIPLKVKTYRSICRSFLKWVRAIRMPVRKPIAVAIDEPAIPQWHYLIRLISSPRLTTLAIIRAMEVNRGEPSVRTKTPNPGSSK